MGPSEAVSGPWWRASLSWWLGEENLRELSDGGGARTPVSNDAKPRPPQESTMATMTRERPWAARRWREACGIAVMQLEREIN
mmetsp:Transcript_97091/g.283724  ORF Transcript_97091/g.283724 Transcript_97091/m.283724 type:complete len:83 (+) Transcript_97091:469-717(+)